MLKPETVRGFEIGIAALVLFLFAAPFLGLAPANGFAGYASLKYWIELAAKTWPVWLLAVLFYWRYRGKQRDKSKPGDSDKGSE
jgi:hypothetical protein